MDMRALMANPKVQDMLMTAGLSMLASNQSRVGAPSQSFGSSLGQGLLTGMQYSNQQEQEREAQALKQQRMGMEERQLEGQIKHWGTQNELTRTQNAEMADFRKRQLEQTGGYQMGQLQNQQAELELRRKEQAERLAADQLRFREGVRQFDTGLQVQAPMQKLQQDQGALKLEQERLAMQKEEEKRALTPVANTALQKVFVSRNQGQSPQVSDEEMTALAKVYGDRPEFLTKLFEGQYATVYDPTTQQTMQVPVGAALKFKAAQVNAAAKGAGDIDIAQQLKELEGGGAPSAPAASNPQQQQYAQRVQQALAGKTPQEQEALKQQMRQELQGADPAFLRAIGL